MSVIDTNFFSDVVPMKINGTGCQIHRLGNFLSGFAPPDQIDHLHFSGGQLKKLSGYIAHKWGNDFV